MTATTASVGCAPAVQAEVTTAIQRASDDLLGLSHAVHEQRELGFEEHASVAEVVRRLADHGHTAEVGVHGMPTALRAQAGTGRPTVAILAEYDALPEVGHGCGHNVICAAAVGAFLGAAAAVEHTGGSVVLLGTPAEENGGGKEILARAGAFDDIDAAVMIHPMAGDGDVAHFSSLGCRSVTVTYHGQAAHASAAPHLGRNALDATVAAYQGIAALRQHIEAGDRVHGIITDGGQAPNVVPELSASVWLLRAATVEGLSDLCRRADAIFQGAAQLTGTTVTVGWDTGPAYLPVRSSNPLDTRYAVHARARDRRLLDDLEGPNPPGGSTDLGNVSVRIPAIHPTLAIAPSGVPMHSAQFAEHARSAEGDRAVLDAAVALALTTADYLADTRLRDEVAADFEASGGVVDVAAVLGDSTGSDS